MARKLASAMLRTSAATDDGPNGFAWVCGASVRRGPLLGPFLGKLFVARPDQKRDDQQDAKPAGNADEPVEARHDAVGRLGSLNQSDDEDEGRLGPDITHAMLAELDLHADPYAGADH